ncbi:MAG TPA: TIGR03435 family protein [Bryobacteraceae bacterium]|nr:TIGR03435 family protein [Bryobacteraceae bacterium]
MNRSLMRAALAAFVFHCAAAGAEPAFEVASITPCAPGTPAPEMEHTGLTNWVAPGGRFTARATTVVFLMEWAYGIQPWQHSDGPGWLSSDRFDIVAKSDHDAQESEMKLMARRLLSERFGLRVHRERKEMPAYLISVGKNAPKLSTPKDGETHAMRFSMTPGPDGKITVFHIEATRYTLAQLADVFARRMDRVIVNQTGMEGEYDFTLDLTPDEGRPSPVDQSLLLGALRQQIGLDVRAARTAVDYYVIDGAEKRMTVN